MEKQFEYWNHGPAVAKRMVSGKNSERLYWIFNRLMGGVPAIWTSIREGGIVFWCVATIWMVLRMLWDMGNKRFVPALTLFGGFEMPRVRSLRIPYVGSKNAIASQIIEAILSNTRGHGSRRFVDAFCGGGAIMYGVHSTGMFGSILGNDLHGPLMGLHRDLPRLDLEYIARTPCLLLPNKVVQERYPFVRMIDEIPAEYQMAFRVVYSFGNDCRTNLWGDRMVVKYALSQALMHEPGAMGGLIAGHVGASGPIPFDYPRDAGFSALYKAYKAHIGLFRKAENIERLERLQQLQQLEQLEQVSRLQHLIDFTSTGYAGIEYRPDDVVYFDPPYQGTVDYHGCGFDNAAFEDFARSLKCPVFISEYKDRIDGFTPVMRVGKLSTLNNKGSLKADKQRFEVLHWNGIS